MLLNSIVTGTTVRSAKSRYLSYQMAILTFSPTMATCCTDGVKWGTAHFSVQNVPTFTHIGAAIRI